MKKLVAILFLSLITLTSLSGKLHLREAGYELATDSEELETQTKEKGKEVKEFTLHTLKKLSFSGRFTARYKRHEALILPQPPLDQHTPPPDATC